MGQGRFHLKKIDSFAAVKGLRADFWRREGERDDKSVEVLANNSSSHLIIEHVSQSWFKKGRKFGLKVTAETIGMVNADECTTKADRTRMESITGSVFKVKYK